jgi:hypothetical protein
LAFLVYTTADVENVESVKGPVPTGVVLVYVAGVVILDQMCSGKIIDADPSVPKRMVVASGVSGLENVNTTVLGPEATTEVSGLFHTPFKSSAGFALR